MLRYKQHESKHPNLEVANTWITVARSWTMRDKRGLPWAGWKIYKERGPTLLYISIRSETIHTDLEPCGQLSLIQWELCTQTEGGISFFCPLLITGFWHFFGLSEKDPKQRTNNGRSHMMEILLIHPQGSVVFSLRENYSGAKDKSKITHLLFLVRSINIASTWRRSSCLLRGARSTVPCMHTSIRLVNLSPLLQRLDCLHAFGRGYGNTGLYL